MRPLAMRTSSPLSSSGVAMSFATGLSVDQEASRRRRAHECAPLSCCVWQSGHAFTCTRRKVAPLALGRPSMCGDVRFLQPGEPKPHPHSLHYMHAMRWRGYRSAVALDLRQHVQGHARQPMGVSCIACAILCEAQGSVELLSLQTLQPWVVSESMSSNRRARMTLC